ncbi:MAG: cytochrome d ubiquinol oxidase subunit II [Elusimicrobia bacterium]|nr:cytochrome d ubiquinol oxidase subunit II [Elusimicrobiota bacterium]
MFPLEAWIAIAIFAALMVYSLTGGADFGGGVWDLFAAGPRAARQRDAIARALSPIWEANHVWLIVVMVLLFVAFPKAFADIGIALHIPLAVMLIGIVMRGSAFAFRSYTGPSGDPFRRWSLLFAVASTVTPIMLGVSVGAVAGGRLRAGAGGSLADFFSSWLAPFPFVLGVFALTLFAFVAAVYLTLETDSVDLKEDFRRRALVSGVAVGVMAWTSFFMAKKGAPLIHQGLSAAPWALPFHLVTGAAALGVFGCLWKRRYRAARVLVVVQAALIIWGWGMAQFPFVIVPDLTVANAAAPESVLRPVLWALLAGSALVVPSFWYLYFVFKGERRARI